MKKEDQRLNVKWKAPPRDWIKGNFDGPAKGTPGKVGYGGVIRDHSGNVIDAIAIPISISTSHKAKATATLYIMRLVVDIGNWYLWMERDSLNIINMLNDKTLTTWTIEASIMEIKSLMNKFEKVIFTHTYREGNAVADWIANRAVQHESMLRWHTNLSRNVDLKDLINYDGTYVREGKIFQD